jgi:SAM-dependent methyltransferase
MNPRPTLETLAYCYPAGYGPHEPSIEYVPQDVSETGAKSTSSQTVRQPDQSAAETTSKVPWYLSKPVRSIPGLKHLYYWLSDDRSEFLPAPADADSKAIELGCATGKYLLKLRDAGWLAEGVELVESAAAAAQKLGFPTHVGTLESAGLNTAKYDGAFAWHVLEHLPDPRAALIEFHRVLKDDAQLAFSVPNVACWEPAFFGRSWYVWELPRHLQFYSPASLRRLLTETGFDEIRIVHQRTLLNVIGSFALLIKRFRPESRLANKLLAYPDHPRMWWQLLLAPAAIFLAMIRQGGRLTVIARCNKPPAKQLTHKEEQSSESA